MTEKSYGKISAPFHKNEKYVRALNLVNLILTVAVYIAYPSLLLFVLITDREKLLRCILVPAVMFVSVSILRKIINRPRPYEKLGISPLIKKDKKGESMPSRHVFSVFMIATSFLYVLPALSVPLFIIGILLSAVRIIGGVHYPSDILVGAAIGIISGIIGFFVI